MLATCAQVIEFTSALEAHLSSRRLAAFAVWSGSGPNAEVGKRRASKPARLLYIDLGIVREADNLQLFSLAAATAAAMLPGSGIGVSRDGADVRRREFITIVGSATVWPLTAHAQAADRLRRIGVLISGASDAEAQARIAVFQRELQKLGWTIGRNVQID